MDPMSNDSWREGPLIPHYYGDYVRRFFIAGGIGMLLVSAYYRDSIQIPFVVTIFALLLLIVAAGFTDPKRKWIMTADAIGSLVAVAAFELHAFYGGFSTGDSLFWANHLLALNFFFAGYFSVKTLRGVVLK